MRAYLMNIKRFRAQGSEFKVQRLNKKDTIINRPFLHRTGKTENERQALIQLDSL